MFNRLAKENEWYEKRSTLNLDTFVTSALYHVTRLETRRRMQPALTTLPTVLHSDLLIGFTQASRAKKRPFNIKQKNDLQENCKET
jgi:hypothetical protein